MVITLTQIVRQEGAAQKKFREALLRLRIGLSEADDYKLFSTRIRQPTEIYNEFNDAIYLMHSNSEVKLYNYQKLQKLNTKGERL